VDKAPEGGSPAKPEEPSAAQQVDLTGETVAGALTQPVIVDLSLQPLERPNSPQITEPSIEPPEREQTRSRLAMTVVLTLPLIVVLSFWSLMAHFATAADVKEVATFLLAPLVGIAGAVLGFYFGERRR
jgi:hypothetical protein